jgi:hypothetical protein
MPYKHREDLYKAQKRHRMKIREHLLVYLSDKFCIDCNENDPIVLDFDHRNRSKKFKPVSRMLSGHYGWKTIMREIEKCDIRCANCHRRKTYNQLGYWGKIKPS